MHAVELYKGLPKKKLCGMQTEEVHALLPFV